MNQKNQMRDTPLTEADLDLLGKKILKQWREARPKMTAQMEAAGKLYVLVFAHQENVEEYRDIKRKMGMPEWQVIESSQELWMLPSEEDLPDL